MKCECCGKSLGFMTKYVTLSNGGICKKCFEALGFDFADADQYADAKVSEIKSGYGHYHRSDAYKAMDILEEYGLPTLRFSHYGERRSVDATEEEMKMFQFLRDMFEDAGFDPSQLELVRKSDDYVSAVVGDWDLARLKFTERAAWIIFPYAEHKAMKHRIYFPEEIVVMTDLFDAQVKALATHTELKHMD